MANNRRRLMGRVVSDKMDKTVVVEIERRKIHRVYEKVLVTNKKIMAHDETNEIPLGSLVRVVESRPLSKRKRWVVEEVLERPDVPIVTEEQFEFEPTFEPTDEAEAYIEPEAEVEEEVVEEPEGEEPEGEESEESEEEEGDEE